MDKQRRDKLREKLFELYSEYMSEGADFLMLSDLFLLVCHRNGADEAVRRFRSFSKSDAILFQKEALKLEFERHKRLGLSKADFIRVLQKYNKIAPPGMHLGPKRNITADSLRRYLDGILR